MIHHKKQRSDQELAAAERPSHSKPATLRISTSKLKAPTPKSQRFGLFELEANYVAVDSLLPTYHLDIIAVHGLNGNAFTTWTNSHNQIWLQDFLPQSLPGARVYTFGYDSTLFSKSKADLGDFARKLLSEVTLVRQSELDKQREIIFICHSLGGIVFKKALVLAHETSRYTNILQSTKAVIFFGTPHAGSEQADFLSVLANIVAAFGSVSTIDRAFGKIRQDLVRMLKPRSVELENLSMSFTERGKDIGIVSFYEENAMPPFKSELVPRSSTRIGVQNEELIPLSDNHRDICRLENERTLAYRKIVQICQAHGVRSNEADPRRSLNPKEQECLRALNVIDMNDCRAQLRPPTSGTCEWILSNNRFRTWISDNTLNLLHITGDMGTGKSILMSYLVDRIKPLMDAPTTTASRNVSVCSFFCDDKDVGRKHGQAILRSLVHQILSQRHDLMEHANARLSEAPPGQWSLILLWEILRDIMLNPITGTIVLIIDAMDECEPISRHRVLNSIRQFLAPKPEPLNNCIKILISSRPSVDLTEEIGQYSSVLSLNDGDKIRDIERDVLLVVKDQLDELAISTQWPTKTREALERSIAIKADRNFLWIRLVIQRLKKGPQNKKFFEQVVDESPRDLDGLYCRILADIEMENQDLATKILRILVGLLRPITTAELRLALAIDLNHHLLESVEEESDMAIERTIRLALGSLIRIYNLKVLLVHQSAKEFLLRLSTGSVANLRSFESDLRVLYGISIHDANLELATACIAFLGLADFESNRVLDENVSAFNELPGAADDSPLRLMDQASDILSNDPREFPMGSPTVSRDEKPHFFEYSASHWTSHLCASGEPIPQHVLESAIRLSHRNTNCLSNWSDQYRLSSRDLVALPKDLDPLIVAAFFGLVHLANEVLDNYTSELQEGSKYLALSWACRMGHVDMVKVLLNHGTSLSGELVEGGSPLSWACAGGHLEIVEVLLNIADTSQVNMRDINWRTPLSLAVGSSHLAVMKLLLAREDVDVNLDDRTGSTPLLWAIGSKSEKQDLIMLECLVSESRVDIASRDLSGRTVLSWAAEMGALEAINILIHSPRPDIQSLLQDTGDTGKGWSPLSWAAFNGHVEVVRALCMTRRIDVQLASVDKGGQNAILLAADRNNAEIIKVLAEFYPQGVDYPEESGRTPLSCSMWGSPSNAKTVRALLETGLVDVNRKALNGRTPLSYAAAAGRADLVRILVEEGGADLDILDNDGNAPGDVQIDWRSSQVKEEIDRLRKLRSRPGLA